MDEKRLIDIEVKLAHHEGTQGYVWDTQSDMAYALTGAVLALLLLGRLHDRQLQAAGFVDR